jgi:hypothetical protein
MTGTLMSPKDAEERGFQLLTGMLLVVLVIFGREVPVWLDPWEVDTAERGEAWPGGWPLPKRQG